MIDSYFRGRTIAVWILIISIPAIGSAQSEAEYTVRFDATWSEQTHPIDFPENPHFSGLIGGTHHGGISFWSEGTLASPGIESMAETGSKLLLQGEIQDAIDMGTAAAIISGGGIPLSPGSVSATFTIEETHPLVTLVSMLAPSPDWFVGVAGLSLREGGEWVPTKVVDLVVYDAGTDSGTNYGSPNQPTMPPIPIYEKTEVPFAEDNVVGAFTFELAATSVATTGIGDRLRLLNRGPNPSRGTSRFEIRAAAGSSVDLLIHDARGRLVRTLLAGERVEHCDLSWDGRDESGRRAPSGVYFVTLRAEAKTRSAKLVLLR
jgi:hypothetical protein